jgi:precorrin-6A/cobalt-precorrin-6A reductase
MTKILIIGGTSEAKNLHNMLQEKKISTILSYAGLTENSYKEEKDIRVGGFGGAMGMSAFIEDKGITHILDASHPFSKNITVNSLLAAQLQKIDYLGFERPKWERQNGDTWKLVSDTNKAIKLIQETDRVFVTIGSKEIRFLNRKPKPFYLIRMINEPEQKMLLDRFKLIFDQGPFTFEQELELMKEFSINKLISKNSGSNAVVEKINAARKLGIEVIMIERPTLPQRKIFTNENQVLQFFSNPE